MASIQVFVRTPSGRHAVALEERLSVKDAVLQHSSILGLSGSSYAVANNAGEVITNDFVDDVIEEDDVLIVTVANAKGA